MGEKTAISWAHHTFNPWRGCSHARFPDGREHPGCLNCYAEFLVTEKFQMGGVKGEWGPGAPRTVAAESGWKEPLRWARAAAEAGERRRVFFSLGDPLDEEAPREAQERFWQLIRDTARLCSAPAGECPDGHEGQDGDCPHCGRSAGGLDWLLLTKRPWRWELIPEDVRPLVWLGTSVSDQPTADRWLGELAKARGFRLRFCSYEPALGAVDLFKPVGVTGDSGWVVEQAAGQPRRLIDCLRCQGTGYFQTDPYVAHCSDCRGSGVALSWLIWGGESGGNRRPGEVSWGRSVADQCAEVGVAFYAKQDTAYRAGQQGRIPDELWAWKEVPHVP